MIVNDRIVAYINSLHTNNSGVLEDIEEQARQEQVPIIRKEMENFLKVMLELKQPKAILEVGTAVGYSAVYMSENMPAGCHITTIENYDKRIIQARQNIKRAKKSDVITLIEGDAQQVLLQFPDETFDFLFMDAAKGQYINFLPEAVRLMKHKAVMISDNVLQEGDIVESRYAVARRNRTIHARMRKYMYTLTHMDELVTSIVPLGDGITVSVKK